LFGVLKAVAILFIAEEEKNSIQIRVTLSIPVVDLKCLEANSSQSVASVMVAKWLQ
jgi:hypothetical protein